MLKLYVKRYTLMGYSVVPKMIENVTWNVLLKGVRNIDLNENLFLETEMRLPVKKFVQQFMCSHFRNNPMTLSINIQRNETPS